jgi:hypothetical protein
MDSAHYWQNVFMNWPSGLPKTGLLVTTFQETIGFREFQVLGGLLYLERDRPDSFGARKILFSFESISALKLTDTRDIAADVEMGFGA